MIYYYTGTGNSRYVAEKIAAAVDDGCENLFERLRTDDRAEIISDKPLVFVSPTYCWQLPHILRDWIEKASFRGCLDAYFIMTCGDDNGSAEKYLRRLCAKTGLNFMGCAEIVMPENYIAMFDVPDKTEALEIVERAKPAIAQSAALIASASRLPHKPVGLTDKIKSGPVNALFYPLFVHAKKFYANDRCVGCGKCAASCVMNNIALVDKRPRWGDNCTHCMACICGCPAQAIEYGKISMGKPRYQCPKG